MKLRKSLHQRLAELVAVSVVIAALSACDSARPNASANSAKDSNSAELFTIPPEQMSHVQVLRVQPTTLTRTLRLTGAVAYNSFRTTPVITQVSGPVSRDCCRSWAKSKSGRADDVCGKPGLLAASH